jgi:hypothetical protein
VGKSKNTIVTHHNPDLDASAATWLIKRFWPNWQDAELEFVPAGTTLNDNPPDEDPQIIHVDTGLGCFDHHQANEYTSATQLVYEETKKRWPEKAEKALSRLVSLVTEIDHFHEVFWHDPTNDRYDLVIHRILDGWENQGLKDQDLLARALELLDGVYQILKDKVWAEDELKEKGVVFDTVWGPAIGVESINDEVMRLAAKQGYVVVVRKDPRKGSVRIKSLPREEIDLTPVFERVVKLDPKASWFFHLNRHMILNGSSKEPKMKPSKLSLEELIKILKEVE